ncbi:MAG: DUF2190 family protein [Ideonella sp.]|nr:DUF2190 family protein [Ideonella sp.]MCC7455984.1 DUF2190 family protein [Nitrospira sp.]
MTALAADRATPSRDGREMSFPVAAATKIYAGALVALNASGVLVPGAVSTTLKCVGVAQEQADNTAGGAGAIAARVRRGVWRMGNSSSADLIALSDVGADCYIVDDQTVAKTNGTNTRSVAGKIRDVDASGVWVEI